MVSERQKEIINVLLLGAILIALMVSVSQFIGYGKGGFGEINNERLFNLYVGPGIGFLIGIIILTIVFSYRFGGKYSDSTFFNSQGEYPALKLGFIKGPFQLFLLSVIIFSILGLVASNRIESFTDVGTLAEQQYTFIDNVAFASALIPASENLGAHFITLILLFGWTYYAQKKNVSKGSYVAVIFAIFILGFGLTGFINHQLRYSSSNVAIFNVIIFWSIGGLITAITGSFIPFFVMHLTNNIFVSVKQSFSSDFVVGTAIGMIIIFGALYLFLYVRRRNARK